ncbi:MAG: carboxypeptidase-like regulatory domain-containing protein, partial [Vicinamibacterales bacterium]
MRKGENTSLTFFPGVGHESHLQTGHYGISLVLLFTSSAVAQIDTGAIVGRVGDDSGAVLPGVTVTAVQEGTGVTATSVTNERGEYIFPGLRVGRYMVTAELPGFRRAIQRDVTVNVQTRAQVDLRLDVGAITEEVIVKGVTEMLQTQTVDIGGVVEQRQVRDLPLLGRRYSELAFLVPGSGAALGALTASNRDQISQVFSVKATARPEAGQDNIEANEAEHIDRLVGLRLRLV